MAYIRRVPERIKSGMRISRLEDAKAMLDDIPVGGTLQGFGRKQADGSWVVRVPKPDGTMGKLTLTPKRAVAAVYKYRKIWRLLD